MEKIDNGGKVSSKKHILETHIAEKECEPFCTVTIVQRHGIMSIMDVN